MAFNYEKCQQMADRLGKIGRRYGFDYFDESGDEDGKLFDHFIRTLDDYEEVPFDTLVFNKKGYESFYNKASKLEAKGELYEAYLSHDVSGYNYWTLDMEESNYLILAIQFKKDLDEISDSDLEKIFDEIQDKILFPIQRHWSFLIDNPNYTRKRK